jgi:hypothetical protein
MEPQEGLSSTHDYLLALAERPERVFGGPTEIPGARDTGWPGVPPLGDAEVAAVRDTWKRLGRLICYHSGGFYIPGSLSPEARYTAYSLLQSEAFGVRHRDMQMTRFVVRWARPGDVQSDATLALTGWEHAARAPLWSCARMPSWLGPHLHPFERITWEGQRNVRQFLFHSVLHGDFVPRARAWEWVVAHVFGATERWFEGLVGAHWGFRDAAEVLLLRLREHWMRERPDVPFPLDGDGDDGDDEDRLGGRLRLGVSAAAAALSEGETQGDDGDTEAQTLLAHTRTFIEEVSLAMDALGSEIAAAQEALWRDSPRKMTDGGRGSRK